MQDQNRRELDNLMRSYNDNLGKLKSKRTAEKESQEKFMADFEKLKKDTIWPVLVDIGNTLNTYGHDYHISEAKEYMDATAYFHPASITFNIYPATLNSYFQKPESTPFISFLSNRYAKKVVIMVSTMMPDEGGVMGEHGSYDVTQITKAFIEDVIIDVLTNTLILNHTKHGKR